jgi:hypothetical protein
LLSFPYFFVYKKIRVAAQGLALIFLIKKIRGLLAQQARKAAQILIFNLLRKRQAISLNKIKLGPHKRFELFFQHPQSRALPNKLM